MSRDHYFLELKWLLDMMRILQISSYQGVLNLRSFLCLPPYFPITSRSTQNKFWKLKTLLGSKQKTKNPWHAYLLLFLNILSLLSFILMRVSFRILANAKNFIYTVFHMASCCSHWSTCISSRIWICTKELKTSRINMGSIILENTTNLTEVLINLRFT